MRMSCELQDVIYITTAIKVYDSQIIHQRILYIIIKCILEYCFQNICKSHIFYNKSGNHYWTSFWYPSSRYMLTPFCLVMHISVCHGWVILGSGNNLSPSSGQSIIKVNQETNFGHTWIKMQNLAFMKMFWEMSFPKCRPAGPNKLKTLYR